MLVSEMPHGGQKLSGGKDMSMYGLEDYTVVPCDVQALKASPGWLHRLECVSLWEPACGDNVTPASR
jgi:hypothetical protein